MKEDSLAFEMLKELKAQSKRWFIISIISIIITIGTNIGWLIYNSQFETTYTDEIQTIEDIEETTNSSFTQTIN